MNGNEVTENNRKSPPILEEVPGGIDYSEPLNPYVVKHEIHLDCSFLDNSILSTETAHEIAECIARRMSNLEAQTGEVKPGGFSETRTFFKWLEKHLTQKYAPQYMCQVVKNLLTSTKPRKNDWQRVMDDFRRFIEYPPEKNPFVKKTSAKASRSQFTSRVRKVLELCVARGILPDFKLKKFKGSSEERNGRGVIGDIKSSMLTKKDAEEMLGSVLDSPEMNIDKDEKRACYDAMASAGINLAGLDEVERVKAVVEFNKARLEDIRRSAEKDFIKAWETYQEGQQLIEDCDLSYEDDMRGPLEDLLKGLVEGKEPTSIWSRNHPFRTMMNGSLENVGRKGSLERVPLDDAVAKGRLLTLLDGRYGMAPKRELLGSPVAKAWENILSKHTERKIWAEERLGLTDDAMFCAQLIILIDTAFNCTVVETLPLDCVREVASPSKKEIWGKKKRANDKEVSQEVHLKEKAYKLNSIQVIERIRVMTGRFRKLAATEQHDLLKTKKQSGQIEKKLFIRTKHKKGSTYLTVGLYASKNTPLKDFNKRHECINHYRFSPSIIRPTKAFIDFIEGRSIEKVAASLNHSQSKGNLKTTQKYVTNIYTKTLMEKLIREYMDDFEALFLDNIEGAAEKLGYTPDEFKERVDRARTGFGTFCNPLDEEVNDDELKKKNTGCNPYEECPQCLLARVVPASQNNLLDSALLNGYLKKESDRLRNENPARWLNVHMRWLALTEGVIKKAKVDPKIPNSVVNQALQKAEEMLGAGAFPPLF